MAWDVYLKESFKSTTRENRGKGVRRRMASTTVLPPKWNNFLNVDDNKTEPFQFLSEQVVRLVTEEGVFVFATNGSNVMCSLSSTSNCSTVATNSRSTQAAQKMSHLPV